MRLKGYNPKLVPSTYFMALRLLENFCERLKLGACDFGRFKKSSKSWNLGSPESLWEKHEYEDDHNFELSGSALECRLVSTSHASYKVV